MRSGALRDRVRIERPTQGRDGRGQPETNWKTLASARGELRQLSGKEREAAQQVTAEASWRLKLRRLPGVVLDTTCRVVELATGRELDILAVLNPDGRGRNWTLELKDHSPAGVGGGPQR